MILTAGELQIRQKNLMEADTAEHGDRRSTPVAAPPRAAAKAPSSTHSLATRALAAFAHAPAQHDDFGSIDAKTTPLPVKQLPFAPTSLEHTSESTSTLLHETLSSMNDKAYLSHRC